MSQSDWKRFAALVDFDHDGAVRIDECAPRCPPPPPAVCDDGVPWLWVCRWLKWRKQATELIVQRAGTHLGLLLGSDSHTKQGAGAGFGALW